MDIGRVKLHDEMVDILSEAGATGLSYAALAERVNARGVYLKGDGSPVHESQIRLRARNYDRLFLLGDGRVRLRSMGISGSENLGE